MIRVSNVRASLTESLPRLMQRIADLTGWKDVVSVKVAKRSVDARNKRNIHFLYAFDVCVSGNEREHIENCPYRDVSLVFEEPYLPPVWRCGGLRPVVVGAGPAGMMAALALAEAGARPIVLERGKPVSERRADVRLFWETGRLDPSSNVQFGEGGAGTFSDGKLNTGIKKDAFTRKVLDEFVAAGAPEEILWQAKPHVGTDKLAVVVRNLREKIISLGGEYRFETRLTDIGVREGALKTLRTEAADGKIEEFAADAVVLAVGHSARDTFEMLLNRGVTMLQKPFSVGVRIEHPQSLINRAQYGSERPPKGLGAADYKLAVHLKNGRSVYTFCMCPGGEVVAAASEAGRLVTNGMSEFARDKANANSAFLVGVTPEDFGSNHPLAGVEFQRRIEEAAFRAGGGGYKAPVQRVGDLLEKRESRSLGRVVPSYRPGVEPSDLRAVLPSFAVEAIREALKEADKKLKGFADGDAVLTAAETRSSSPVRMVRDADAMQSVSVAGLYPCGEGAGYAGGIMSAAADGLKCAAKVCEAGD